MMRLVFALGLLLAVASPLAAEPVAKNAVIVSQAWLSPTPKGELVIGGATLQVTGTTYEALQGGSLPMAPKGEVFHVHGPSVQRAEDVAIRPGSYRATLKSGGYFLVFRGLTEDLTEGKRVQGELDLAEAGKVPVTFVVGGPLAADSAPAEGVDPVSEAERDAFLARVAAAWRANDLAAIAALNCDDAGQHVAARRSSPPSDFKEALLLPVTKADTESKPDFPWAKFQGADLKLWLCTQLKGDTVESCLALPVRGRGGQLCVQ